LGVEVVMNAKKLLLAAGAGGVVGNIIDFIVHGMILRGQYAAHPEVFRQVEAPTWFIIGDFVAALVFVWVYDRVYGSFGGGPKGGATFGLYAGILVNFPTMLFMHLVFDGFSYGMAWAWIIVGILWGVVVGAAIGAVYKK
jgi:hypothetical protein